MPVKNKNYMLKFRNYNKFERPYVIYIDFKCVLENIYDDDDDNSKKTTKKKIHTPHITVYLHCMGSLYILFPMKTLYVLNR